MARKKSIKKISWLNFALFFLAMIAGIFILQKSIVGATCANTGNCKESLSLKIENGAVATFSGQKITPPQIDLTKTDESRRVLGEAVLTGEKRIYVDLTTQTLTAYQGDVVFLQTKISSGKWFPTPTGEFTIWEKIRATKMSGGQGADYYYLPNVPYVMFFSGSGVAAGRGFSLHGAYWHNNFGHPMSHGCVNMRQVDAQKLYYWVDPSTNGNVTLSTGDNPGTKIIIYGEAP
ncbi:MAG: hypothetical protein UU16_C0009G0015 [Candidatus Woesebacteria bacterium GW2011_GWA2_40_7]|uniref:L,D-TPase catalytic domain-containing protein n=3 Tax=Candidatus Woeseibacteriota TaxID=1752722 RepID=A0A0G0PRC4_9BACT|nr:MAG: hypothetical protein UT17_C0004G0279 [Candidatus Woesebacteria bacterium GW2011_GWB1_39_10]KKR73945.1 MAG: hypothetical protein UU16_C0009G0015 [Candidatus Woesebacteria bacterium GW2011_GWA2_40_7]KKS90922.1 MAG: hypothetical protein UV66_C0001G0279 [Candidatus Woesebacteria bacterium GW2011_GWA1_43_12]